MGEFGIISFFRWMDYIFPSLSVYLDIIGPALLVLVGVVSVFTNIMPDPGHQFEVPCKQDIELELKDKNWKIYYLTKISRTLTICINLIMRSFLYKWFFYITKSTSLVLRKMNLTRRKSDIELIKIPPVYVSNKELDEFISSDEKTEEILKMIDKSFIRDLLNKSHRSRKRDEVESVLTEVIKIISNLEEEVAALTKANNFLQEANEEFSSEVSKLKASIEHYVAVIADCEKSFVRLSFVQKIGNFLKKIF